MARFVAGDRELRNRLRGALVVAVDLGFAEHEATCGIAWRVDGSEQKECATFGGCIRRVATLLAAPTICEAALIVEAPLSGCFNADGNPIARDYGETRESGASLESGRGWYYGVGANVALAALFFLRRLRDALATNDITVVLFEGFVSFKKTKTEHVDDARLLLDCFVSSDVTGHRIRALPGCEMVTSLGVLGEPGGGAPLVLIPPPRVLAPEVPGARGVTGRSPNSAR